MMIVKKKRQMKVRMKIMNDIKYSPPRIDEIDKFLLYLYTIGIQNPDVEINNSLVYRELCKYSLRDDEVLANGELRFCGNLFQDWKNNITNNGENRDGLKIVYESSWPHFLQI